MTTFKMLALWTLAASLAFTGALDVMMTSDTTPVLKHGPSLAVRPSRDDAIGDLILQLKLWEHANDVTRAI